MIDLHKTREQAEEVVNQMEQAYQNQPAAAPQGEVIRAMTPEEIEAFEKQQETNPSPDGWVLLDGMPYIPSFPIPRALAGFFTNAGYVEIDGILYSPGSQMVQDAIGAKTR